MKNKKKSFFFALIAVVTALACLLTACNNGGDEVTPDDGNKDEVCEHEWQTDSTVSGNCKTKGYVVMKCSKCGETKKEEDEDYGDHNYENHVCTICGARQSGVKDFTSGSLSAALYTENISFSGETKYSLFLSGNGRMDNYKSSASTPWASYVSQIVRLEFEGSAIFIGDNAFSDMVSLTTVNFHSAVASIGNGAFKNCTSLHTLDTGTPLRIIGERAFEGCTSLTTIKGSASTESVGAFAFYGCNRLSSVSLGIVGTGSNIECEKAVGAIFGYTTEKFDARQTVTFGNVDYYYYIPSSLTEFVILGGQPIATGAFAGCTNLTSVVFGGEIKRIEEQAFDNAKGVKNVKIETNSLEYIGQNAFCGAGITSIVIPATVTAVGGGAFMDCDSLVSVIYEDGSQINEVCAYTFARCTALTEIRLPESMEIIGNYAFLTCSALETIRFTSNITTPGENCFENCTKLSTIVLDSESVANVDKRSKLFASADNVFIASGIVPSENSYLSNYFVNRGKCAEDDVYPGYYHWKRIKKD